MKKIVLIPIKNESWILENTISNISPHVDQIIIADQNSTDNSVDICNKFSNVKVVNNPYTGHSNKVRWLLLKEARKIEGDKLIICIDADEIFSPKAIDQMINYFNNGKAKKGTVFNFRWIQLWESVDRYMNDGAWKNSYKNIAFIDNPNVNEYEEEFVINDHTSRIPDSNINNKIRIDYPLLHFHFVPVKRTQMKQAWYRCCELIEGKRNAKRINNTYRVTLPKENIKTYSVKEEWISGLNLPKEIESIGSDWHLNEIKSMFDKHSIDFFEDLQIWHIPELKEEFIKRANREPISKTYPKILVFINEVKNFVLNKLVR